MKTTQFNISLKAGETQTLRWLIVQEVPFPDITSNGSSLAWRNTGRLFPEFGNPARGIGQNYWAYLLNPTANPGDNYSRTDFAGFKDYKTGAISPGEIVLRGRKLGETSIHFESDPQWPTIRTIDGCQTPTSGERAMFMESIVPPLWAFIKANEAELRAAAIAQIKTRFDAELKEARAELVKLEAKAAQAVY